MNKGTGRGRVRVKLKFVSMLHNVENPVVRSYLAPLTDEEGEPGSIGDGTIVTSWEPLDLSWESS